MLEYGLVQWFPGDSLGMVFWRNLADPFQSLLHPVLLSLPGVQHLPGSGGWKTGVSDLIPWVGSPESSGETHWGVADETERRLTPHGLRGDRDPKSSVN